jgi:hypothetical protein
MVLHFHLPASRCREEKEHDEVESNEFSSHLRSSSIEYRQAIEPLPYHRIMNLSRHGSLVGMPAMVVTKALAAFGPEGKGFGSGRLDLVRSESRRDGAHERQAGACRLSRFLPLMSQAEQP